MHILREWVFIDDPDDINLKGQYYAVLPSFLMVAVAFAVVSADKDNVNAVPELSALENDNIGRAGFDRYAAEGIAPGSSCYQYRF